MTHDNRHKGGTSRSVQLRASFLQQTAGIFLSLSLSLSFSLTQTPAFFLSLYLSLNLSQCQHWPNLFGPNTYSLPATHAIRRTHARTSTCIKIHTQYAFSRSTSVPQTLTLFVTHTHTRSNTCTNTHTALVFFGIICHAP